MKNLLQGCVVAFSMYSAIKMPKTDWNKDNMKFAICFFPAVGFVIGVLLLALYAVAVNFSLNAALFSAVAAVLPVIISGGIHFDGFIDTCDALASNQPMERKLEILKDSHVGAFAIIASILYFLLSFGFWNQIYTSVVLENNVGLMICYCIIPILSRAVCAIGLVTYNCAKSSGLAYMFSDGSDKTTVRNVSFFIAAVCCVTAFAFSIYLGLMFFLVSVIYYLRFKKFADKNFGGFTGDLAGYFIQIFELLFLAIAVGSLVFK